MKLPLSIKNCAAVNPEPAPLEVKFGSREDGIEMGLSDLVEMYEFVKSLLPLFAPFLQ
jgi:hypothetical protein